MAITGSVVVVPLARTAYATNPDFDAGFAGEVSLAISVPTASAVKVWFSFDGRADAGCLVAASPAAAIATSQPYRRVWLRHDAVVGADSEVSILVETED